MAIPATPITSRIDTTQSPLSVEELIEILQDPEPPSPQPEATIAIEKHVNEENTLENDATIMDRLDEMFENEHVGGAGSGIELDGGGGDQPLQTISVHSGSDDDENANDNTLANNAETESRVYDTQDEMEQMDDVFSANDAAYVRVEWTPDQLAEFILEEDKSLGKFALFIRNERIDGGQVPLISYDVIKDAAVTTSTGEMLRFLKAVEKWKVLFNSIEKVLNSSLSRNATETA